MLSAYGQPTRTCRVLEQVRPLTGCDRLTNNAVGPAAVVKTLVVRLGVGGRSKVGPRARMLPETTDRITGPFILTSRHSSNSSLPASTVTMRA